LVADSHLLVLEGLRKLLEPDFKVVAIATDGQALVRLAQELKPQAIVLNLTLPLLSGVTAAHRLRRLLPGTALVFLGPSPDPACVREARNAGGTAYVPKQAAAGQLVRALREALRGQRFVAPPAPQQAWERAGRDVGELTARQREVLKLAAEGRTGKEIATALGISPKTVEFHKARIAERLGVRGTAELVRYALRRGLTNNG
jgi:DNA-binding NarL/FixJ family response regulator